MPDDEIVDGGAVEDGDVVSEDAEEGEDVGEPIEPALSAEIIERAKGYGLEGDDLGYFGGEDSRAERMFAAIDRRTMGPTPGAVPEAQPNTVIQQQEAYKPFEVTFGEDLDESVSGPMRGMVDHFNTTMKQAHEFRQAVENEIRAINLMSQLNNFDGYINGLGPEWAEQYGAGSTLDMDPQSKAFQTRMDVFRGGDSLMANQNGQGTMRQGAAWKRSHQGHNYDRIAEMERKKLEGKITERSTQFGERPTSGGKKPSGLTPREAAVKAIQGR